MLFKKILEQKITDFQHQSNNCPIIAQYCRRIDSLGCDIHDKNSGSTVANNCNSIVMTHLHLNISVSCANRYLMKPHVDHLESMTMDSNVHLLAMATYWQQNLPVYLTSWKNERKEMERSDWDAKIPIFKLSTHNWAQWLGEKKLNHIILIHFAFAYSYTHAQKAP